MASNAEDLDPRNHYRSFPPSDRVRTALQSHISVLRCLTSKMPIKKLILAEPSVADLPVIMHERKNGKLPPAAYLGNLHHQDVAGICYWLSVNVADDPSAFMHRPYYHAVCLVLALHNNISASNAWQKYQVECSGTQSGIDAFQFSLSLLETKMFDQSQRLGTVALSQWGLDAGDHQQRWNPYAYGPTGDEHTAAGWDEDSTEYSEALEVSSQTWSSTSN